MRAGRRPPLTLRPMRHPAGGNPRRIDRPHQTTPQVLRTRCQSAQEKIKTLRIFLAEKSLPRCALSLFEASGRITRILRQIAQPAICPNPASRRDFAKFVC